MNIEALNCRCCGGVLKVSSALCVCEYCGATNFVSDTAGKYITQLNRANKLRQEKEYDNALRIYDNILSENIATADILWLRTLCEYGIEYVPDPISSKYFPTLHRIKDESILNYHSYLEAISLCDEKQKSILEKEAKEINRIQTEYLDIAKNEDPYDVFICYKETDEDTKTTTEDVAYCTQLYDILTREGLKVFFSRVTLKDKLSVDYEPYIFAALKSSKAMAVIGSKSEYFTATWVKNEWSRFLKLMEKDMDKQIFFACDDPEELPRAFSLKQAQMLSDSNAMQNLALNISKYIAYIKSGRKTPNNASRRGTSEREVKEMYEKALARSKDGNFPAVLSLTSDILAIAPDMAEAYWLQMTAKLRHNTENIQYVKKDLTLEEDYNKAIEYANDSLKEEYIAIKDKCLENIRLQKEFNDEMDAFVEDYENNLSSTELYQRREKIISELDSFIKEKNSTLSTMKLTRSGLERKIEHKVSELDEASNRILIDLQKKGIEKYREFCTRNNLSGRIEIDMESANYAPYRKRLLEESRALKEKYVSPENFLPDDEEVRVGKDKEPDDPMKSYYRNIVNKTVNNSFDDYYIP